MRACELMWDQCTAERVQALVRKATKGTCPCFVGKRCPFIPADVVERLESRTSADGVLAVRSAVNQGD